MFESTSGRVRNESFISESTIAVYHNVPPHGDNQLKALSKIRKYAR